jgi:hypothetical protein
VQSEELDGIRRSLAISGTLPRSDIETLLDAIERSNAQRDAIAAVLAKLGPSFRETRIALNELARIVGITPPACGSAGRDAAVQ